MIVSCFSFSLFGLVLFGEGPRWFPLKTSSMGLWSHADLTGGNGENRDLIFPISVASVTSCKKTNALCPSSRANEPVGLQEQTETTEKKNS
jgi:hypothetical protein